jgi:hypothetical protein
MLYTASSCAAPLGAAFWRTAFLAVGRLATHALISSSPHARAFGVIKTPGGKPCVSIARFNVILELNRPRAIKSGKRSNLMYRYLLIAAFYRRPP